jgi:hypothetical protein
MAKPRFARPRAPDRAPSAIASMRPRRLSLGSRDLDRGPRLVLRGFNEAGAFKPRFA